MARHDVSAELAAKHALPGLLGINRSRDRVQIELDLPKRDDRIPADVLPGVEALALGFLIRLYEKFPSSKRDHVVAAVDNYVVAWALEDDLEHYLTSLAALLKGASLPGRKPPQENADAAR